jgi:hypothetical protein
MKPRHTQPKVRRGNPLLQERIHDPYKASEKLPEPTRCPECGAVFSDGRWRWVGAEPVEPHELLCPACRRIKDRYPAGEVIISGAFATAHADEVLNLVCNTEQAERREHPLHRIMDIQKGEHDVTVTTTDVHLPRRIGHALEDAWKGELSTHYDEDGYFARVTWRRDE